MAEKNRLPESIHHLVVGFVLALKGFDKMSHYPILGGFIFVFGILILAYFFYGLKKDPRIPLKIIVHIFEGAAMMLTALVYFNEGKTFLPYVFLVASIGFFAATFIILRKKDPHSH